MFLILSDISTTSLGILIIKLSCLIRRTTHIMVETHVSFLFVFRIAKSCKIGMKDTNNK